MTYEEKRELRLQISQLLADAGLNQKAIKDMVFVIVFDVYHILHKETKWIKRLCQSLAKNS